MRLDGIGSIWVGHGLACQLLFFDNHKYTLRLYMSSEGLKTVYYVLWSILGWKLCVTMITRSSIQQKPVRFCSETDLSHEICTIIRFMNRIHVQPTNIIWLYSLYMTKTLSRNPIEFCLGNTGCLYVLSLGFRESYTICPRLRLRANNFPCTQRANKELILCGSVDSILQQIQTFFFEQPK